MNQIVVMEELQPLENLEAPLLDNDKARKPYPFEVLSDRPSGDEFRDKNKLREVWLPVGFFLFLGIRFGVGFLISSDFK